MSKEYAAALFSLAAESGEQTQIMDALKEVSAVFEENPEYLIFLSSQNIPKKERIQAVQQLLTGRVPEYVLSFVSVLCERGHVQNFSECVSEYIELYRAYKNISAAEVISAVPLTDEEKTRITEKLKARAKREVALSCVVDPSILGGLIVKIDGQVLDNSVRHRLNQVKKVMDR